MRGLEPHEVDVLLALTESVVLAVDRQTHAVTPLGPESVARLGLADGATKEANDFWSIVPDASRVQVLAAIRATALDGVPRSLEHPTAVGGPRDAVFRTTVQATGPRLLVVMRDVTEITFVERQSREVESMLAALGEALPFDVWVCDVEGRCVLQNSVSRARRGNVLGAKNVEWQDAVAGALGGRPVQTQRTSEAGGAKRHVVEIVTPIDGEDGVRAVVGVEIDVTQLEETKARLETSLVELREAQASLVRKEQLAALGEMAALVAHEVRNPLAAISNALTLLERLVQCGGREVELARIIGEEVSRLERLVANLLDFVRPMSLSPISVSLPQVVDEALERALLASGRGAPVHVDRHVDATLGKVTLDPHLLGLALRNVFENALHAMCGKGELSVAIDREESEGRAWCRVSIRDSGPGLASDVCGRLFEPFVTTRPTGSGLGLTIVRRVVEEHRGRVELSSEPGRGTLCVLRLPQEPVP